jgi:hypothetical protein
MENLLEIFFGNCAEIFLNRFPEVDLICGHLASVFSPFRHRLRYRTRGFNRFQPQCLVQLGVQIYRGSFSLYGHNVTSLCSYVTIAPRRYNVNIIIFVL